MRLCTGLLLTAALLLPGLRAQDNKPLLVFSTFNGGNRDDRATAVTTDEEGNTYVAGETHSADFPGKPLPNSKPGSTNHAYVMKLNAKHEVQWSYILGGSALSYANAIVVDKQGSVYVTGKTGAKDFPLEKPVQSTQPGLNIGFVSKLDKDGKLLFSTYLGQRQDEPFSIALDSRGNFYIAGRAGSNFPVKNAMQAEAGGGNYDAFVAKFTADYHLEFATYVGGSGAETIHGIAIGPDDHLFVTGVTYSRDMATEGAMQTRIFVESAFIGKLRPAGNGWSWFTYLGGRVGYTVANAIAVDANGSAYVVGHTSAKDLPVTDKAVQPRYAGGHRDAFLVKLNPEGSKAEYLTYLGGATVGKSDPDEIASAVRVDRRGHVYIAGETLAPDLPTQRALQPLAAGEKEAFLIRLDLNEGKVLSSTFWGGSKNETAQDIALGPGENVTLVGQTWSADMKTASPLRGQLTASNDAYVTKMCHPWLGAYPGEVRFDYVIGGVQPAEVELDVYSGCTANHEVTAVESDAAWLRFSPGRGGMPAKVKVAVVVSELQPGEHRGQLTVTVPEALNGPLRIPVVLNVAEPPPVE